MSKLMTVGWHCYPKIYCDKEIEGVIVDCGNLNYNYNMIGEFD